jgi:hypothetical protein
MSDRATLDEVVDLIRRVEAGVLGAHTQDPPLVRRVCMELLERRANELKAEIDVADKLLDACGPTTEPADWEEMLEIMNQARELAESALAEARKR